MRIIVVGKTGNGKSSTINTIAGEKLFVNNPSTIGMTKKCQSATIVVGGTDLLVVDTPDLYSTDLTQKETLSEIRKLMGITSPGFHAVILVVRVGRFTDEEKHCIDMLVAEFGPELYKRMVILFTGTDDLECDGIEFDEFIQTDISHTLGKIISKCDNRVVGFNNRADEGARKIQVEKLMNLLQNIVKSNNNTYYTNETYVEIEKKLDDERQRRLEGDETKTAANACIIS